MKTFFVILAAFSLTLFFACQENSITDPVINDTGIQHSTPMENTLDKDALSYYSGAIKLERILLDPSHHFNAYAEINGILRYRLEYIRLGARPPYSGIKVSLYVNAEIKGGCPNYRRSWTVNETAETVVLLNSSAQLMDIIEKSFNVHNNCCGKLKLVLNLRLFEKQLDLESMRLVKVNTLIDPISDPISN
jgi:hypothetical protein